MPRAEPALGPRPDGILGAIRCEDADIVLAGSTVLREVMSAFDLPYCLVGDSGGREGAVLVLSRGREIADVS